MGPAAGGLPQVSTGDKSKQRAAGGTSEKNVKRRVLGVEKAKSSAMCFANCLPSEQEQKSSVKPIFIRAWMDMSALPDCSSHINISNNSR
jgi:hypothetical protein